MSGSYEAEAATSQQHTSSSRGKRKPGLADDEAWNPEEEQAE